MPRRSSISELQNEEVAPASPLRRSSRLSNVSSPTPSKVITRRSSASELPTPTARATRGRRSSLTQTSEVADTAEDAKAKIENGVSTPKARTRGSSVPKEVEAKRVTRGRSVSEDKEIKSGEPVKKLTRARSNSLTKKSDNVEVEPQVVTPMKKSPKDTIVKHLETIEETKDEQDAKSINSSKKKSDIVKMDFDLSVIQETSFTEEETSPQKNPKVDKSAEEADGKQSEMPDNSTGAGTPGKELIIQLRKTDIIDTNAAFGHKETDKEAEQEKTGQSSKPEPAENGATNKENISPNFDEPEPMEVDEVEEDLEVAKKITDEVAQGLSSVVNDRRKSLPKQVEDEHSKVHTKIAVASDSNEGKDAVEVAQEVTEATAEAEKSTTENVEELTKTNVASEVAAEESFTQVTEEKEQIQESKTNDATTSDKENETVLNNSSNWEEVMSPSANIILTMDEEECDTHDKIPDLVISENCVASPRTEEIGDDVTEINDVETAEEAGQQQLEKSIVVNLSSEGKETSEKQGKPSTVSIADSEAGDVETNVNPSISLDDSVVASPTTQQIIPTVKIISVDDSEVEDELIIVKESVLDRVKITENKKNPSVISVEDSDAEDVVTKMNSSKVVDATVEENSKTQNNEDNADITCLSDVIDNVESYLSEEDDSYKSPVKKVRGEHFNVSDDDVFTPNDRQVSQNVDLDSDVEIIDDVNCDAKHNSYEEKVVVESKENDGFDNNSGNIKDNQSKQPKEDKTLITLKDTIKAGENKEARLSDRIHKAVDFFCSGIKNEADVSVNVSFEYTGQTDEENGDKTDLVEISFSADVMESNVESQKGSKRRKLCTQEIVAKSPNSKQVEPQNKSPKKRMSNSLVDEENAAQAGLESPKEKRMKNSSQTEKVVTEAGPSPRDKARRKSSATPDYESSFNGQDTEKTPVKPKHQQVESQTLNISLKAKEQKQGTKKRKSQGSLESPKLMESNKVSPSKKQKFDSPTKKPSEITNMSSLVKKRNSSPRKLSESEEELSEDTVESVEADRSKEIARMSSPVKQQKITPSKLSDSDEELSEVAAENVEEEEGETTEESDEDEYDSTSEGTSLYGKIISTSFEVNDDDDYSWVGDGMESELSEDSSESSEDDAAEVDQEEEDNEKESDISTDQSPEEQKAKENTSPTGNKRRKLFRLSRYDASSALDKTSLEKTPAPKRKNNIQNEVHIVPSTDLKKFKAETLDFFVASEKCEKIVPQTSELPKEEQERLAKQKNGKKDGRQAKVKNGDDVSKSSLVENSNIQSFCLKPSTKNVSGWRVRKM